MSNNTKPGRAIFTTLKAVVSSDSPLSVEGLQDATGFDKRKTQRHVAILTEVGVVRRIGDHYQNGYKYAKVLPLTTG